MKLLYINQHLSTGGSCQYTLKQIEEYLPSMEIAVVEVNNYSDEFVVQRDKIAKLVPLYQLKGIQKDIFKVISRFKPDIIHFQELPEQVFEDEILDKIYNDKRKYSIVVTTHSSFTRGNDFRYVPDRIVAVNRWQKQLFDAELPETETVIWEYPIEPRNGKLFAHTTIEEKEEARCKLVKYRGGDNGTSGIFGGAPQWGVKNILNVGLFTPGKNQGELFEVARQNPKNRYHFVGNQAGNFEDYWGPLMEDKPANCIIWGERDDVDLFYQACDEFYFPSKLELNPIVVKEALSYGIPVKMYKLHTYLDDYDNNPLVTFLKPTNGIRKH